MADDAPAAGLPGANERYPWHDATWTTLTRQIDRLPHALLLHGRPGLGKHAFAVQLAQLLLCEQPRNGIACGRCHGCQLFAVGNHPDVSFVGLVEDSKSITIDQIRALGEYLSLRPHTAGRKVVVISPAEAMNPNAANSLLKMLEEPPPGSVLLLATSHPARLLATIRSRCHHVLFKSPGREAGIVWLQTRLGGPARPEGLLDMAGGAPLLAETLAHDGSVENRQRVLENLADLRAGRDEPVACAARWKGIGARLCLGWLYGFVSDLIKLQLGGQVAGAANHELALHAKNKYEISELYGFIDNIHENYRLLGGPLDELLMLESVLIRWVRLRRLQ